MKGNRPPVDPFEQRRADTLKALKDYQNQGSFMSGQGVMDVLLEESDRGAILLIGGVLEDVLAEQIVRKLPHGKKHRSELLRLGGVLGSFQDKLTLGVALGVIDDATLDSLDIIRQLRNTCAHTTLPTTMNVPAINDVIGLLLDDDHAADIKGDRNEDYLRFTLGLVMVYHVERMFGKTAEEAQEVANRLIARTTEEAVKEKARLDALQETPSSQPDPNGRPS